MAGTGTERFQRFTEAGDHNLTAQDTVLKAVARAKCGDSAAMHFLYVRFADDVCAYARSIVRDPHDAEDVTQNVFAKLTTAILKYEEREVPFAAWILRVARNVALDHVRARRQIPVEEVRGTEERDDRIGLERTQSLRAALHELPPDQREVLVLRHLAGLSPAEIATRLGKTEAAIHGLHHRGRITLKSALTELGASPVCMSA